MDENKKQKNKVSGLVFVGCILIGIASGMIFGSTSIGTLMGLGIGFIAMAVIEYESKNKE